MKKYGSILLGSIIIGISFNLFFLQYDIVPNGIYGYGALIKYKFEYEPSLFILILNTAFLLISILTLGKKETKKYILPSILIPIIIFLSKDIYKIIDFGEIDLILMVLSGAFLTGLGYSLIYKEGNSVGGFDILQDIFNSVRVYKRKRFSYFIETIVVILTLFVLNVESMIYSVIAIVIIKIMATKSKIGISTSKTFFIITSKEDEVKEFILNELKHDLTEFNVKGGYSNHKSKIIMTAMDTKDYYRLKEGVNYIDPKAFISIIDSYEVINKNVAINAQND